MSPTHQDIFRFNGSSDHFASNSQNSTPIALIRTKSYYFILLCISIPSTQKMQ